MPNLFDSWDKTTIQDLIQNGLDNEVFDMIGINDVEDGEGVVIIVVSKEKAAEVYKAAEKIRYGEEDYD